MRPEIPAELQAVMDGVEAILMDPSARPGETVYLVGGSVRDVLLGRPAHDYDFASSLTPDVIAERVKEAGKRPYTTGQRFGTVGFKLDGHFIEVTTFRSETYDAGSRKPNVTYVDSITHDLSRRDFTVNAMALRTDGRLIDPFEGKKDLGKKLLRTVGNASERFREDPLRMLRAARFAATLGFTVDPDTESRALKRAHHILDVSRERWMGELDRLLESDDPSDGLRFLSRTHLLMFMIPELWIQVGFDQDSPYHELDLWEHTLKTVRLMRADTTLRWAALLHDVGKGFTRVVNRRGYSNYVFHEIVGAELVEKIARYLKWSNEQRIEVRDLVRYHLQPDSPLHDADTAATKRLP